MLLGICGGFLLGVVVVLRESFCGKDRKKGKVWFKKWFYFGKFFLLSQQKTKTDQKLSRNVIFFNPFL